MASRGCPAEGTAYTRKPGNAGGGEEPADERQQCGRRPRARHLSACPSSRSARELVPPALQPGRYALSVWLRMGLGAVSFRMERIETANQKCPTLKEVV